MKPAAVVVPLKPPQELQPFPGKTSERRIHQLVERMTIRHVRLGLVCENIVGKYTCFFVSCPAVEISLSNARSAP
jgi:hypothetical protein